MTDSTQEEVTLIAREYDSMKKCDLCGYRAHVHWTLGEETIARVGTCGSCTTRTIADTDAYTVMQTTLESEETD